MDCNAGGEMTRDDFLKKDIFLELRQSAEDSADGLLDKEV